jgi:hypothetical protein
MFTYSLSQLTFIQIFMIPKLEKALEVVCVCVCARTRVRVDLSGFKLSLHEQ